ncbi:MAG: hypothetical protein ABFS17_00575 [Chloroflexota bacterium]
MAAEKSVSDNAEENDCETVLLETDVSKRGKHKKPKFPSVDKIIRCSYHHHIRSVKIWAILLSY